MYIIGGATFLLFFLHDFNDWKLGKKCLRFCFPTGMVLLIISTVMMCIPVNAGPIHLMSIRILTGILGVLLLWAEIYSLFFSFSREEAYTGKGESEDRKVCTSRFYALCRHPGVLFFILLYVDLGLCLGMDFPGLALLCFLNLLLAAFEDIFVFPKVFSGYEEYKETTPFLVPRCKSIMRCIGDFRRK